MEMMMERGGCGCEGGKGGELAFVVVMRVYGRMQNGLEILVPMLRLSSFCIVFLYQPKA